MAKEVPRQICFMVMPFGKKDTQAPVGKGPASLSFDSLWEKALRPLIEDDLQYTPVRADQDLGALIVHEMLERLAISDLVLADLSIPNGNVYYEVGIRHAAKDTGCVLIGADWARPLFDVDQMRRVVYPLPPAAVDENGVLTDEAAAAIRAALIQGIQALKGGVSPIRQVFPKYPDIDLDRTSAFKDLMQEMAGFQGRIVAVRRNSDPQDCSRQAKVLRDEYLDNPTALPGLGLELLYLIRDCVGWPELIDYIGRLPDNLRDLPVVREQLFLAQSKAGDHLAAIGALEKLIETMGDTSERRGLIGGRYKKLWLASKSKTDLSRAIQHYEAGMRLDLNAYYPAGNLPRLLRSRARKEDEKLALHAAAVTRLACERAQARGKDNWALLTQLGAAFDEGDVEGAEKLADEVADEGLPAWYIETTLPDLELSAELVPDPEVRKQLEPILEDLRKLLPKK